MKYRWLLFNIWAKAHIIFILLAASLSAYTKFCKYNNTRPYMPIVNVGTTLLYNNASAVYGAVSGAGSGYGFFAPSVRSNGVLTGECGGNQILPVFNSFETTVRFNSLSTVITDYLLNPGEETDSLPGDVAKLGETYYDLLLKSIAVKTYRQNNCTQDSFYFSYNIIDFPTLEQYRRGQRGYSLVKIKEMKLTLK